MAVMPTISFEGKCNFNLRPLPSFSMNPALYTFVDLPTNPTCILLVSFSS